MWTALHQVCGLIITGWGLLPSWPKEPTRAEHPINARAETVATSGMFKRAFQARRCIEGVRISERIGNARSPMRHEGISVAADRSATALAL